MVRIEIRALWHQIKNFTENVSHLLPKNNKSNIKLIICKRINKLLKEMCKLARSRAMEKNYR